jgi:hypothetical protein
MYSNDPLASVEKLSKQQMYYYTHKADENDIDKFIRIKQELIERDGN